MCVGAAGDNDPEPLMPGLPTHAHMHKHKHTHAYEHAQPKTQNAIEIHRDTTRNARFMTKMFGEREPKRSRRSKQERK